MAIPRSKRVLIRSMKAKLKILKRPMVWGSATVVLLASYVGFEYLTHPERLLFSGSPDEEAGETAAPPFANATNRVGDRTLPPPEDNGIGADIDSLSLLFDEIQSNSGAIAPESGVETDSTAEQSENAENSEANQRRQGSSLSFNTPYDLLAGETSNASNSDSSRTSSSFYSRLFSTSPQSQESIAPPSFGLSGSRVSESESSLPTSAPGFSSPRLIPPSASVVSPLQQSIGQRFDSSSNPSGFSTSLPDAAPSGATPLGSEFTSSPLYPGGFSSPSPGTTGYRPPAALRSPTNPYTRLTNPAFTNPGNTGVAPLPSGFSSGVPMPQSAPYQATPYPTGYPSPNSGTTSYPGAVFPTQVTPSGTVALPNGQPNSSNLSNPNRRYTGGGRNGEINTFSNP